MTKENSIEKEKMALLQEKDPIALFLRIKTPAAERSRLGSTFASRKRGIQHFKTL